MFQTSVYLERIPYFTFLTQRTHYRGHFCQEAFLKSLEWTHYTQDGNSHSLDWELLEKYPQYLA